MKKETIVIASGFFDPLHAGHVEYLRLAKQQGDKLVVIVNNDKQTVLKKGYEFMPFKERMEIIKALGFVDEVYPSIDKEIPVTETIRKLARERGIHIFAKGGDRFSYEIPEAAVCKEFGIEIRDGLGMKIQSSSELVEKHKALKDITKDVKK
ncbi:MAG: adenylyltransferase/cytidyltransferase family protein [Nanoarchaeota archaeon]|nr:adenylyltransferase/cytidyltransferase family protein [Nanoarchaeota archaeon]